MSAGGFRIATQLYVVLSKVSNSTYWQVVPYKPPGCACPHSKYVTSANRLTQIPDRRAFTEPLGTAVRAGIPYHPNEALYVKHATSADVTIACDCIP